MANAYVVVDINGDNYGPFPTIEKASEFTEFLICGEESPNCDIVPITIPETDWYEDLFS
jgi:hypothetical protein